jgi:hypothetical protein
MYTLSQESAVLTSAGGEERSSPTGYCTQTDQGTQTDDVHKLTCTQMVGSLKMNTALEYSKRVVQEGDRRCKKSTLNDLVHLTPLRIPLMNPVKLTEEIVGAGKGKQQTNQISERKKYWDYMKKNLPLG